MVWYYPYKNKDEWVSAKLCNITSFDKLISSGMYSENDIRKYIWMTMDKDDGSFLELLQYAYDLKQCGRGAITENILRVLSTTAKYEDDVEFYHNDRPNYKIARLFRVAYGHIAYIDVPMYHTYKKDFFLRIAEAIITVYTILNGTGDCFDVEYVAELYRDILTSTSISNRTDSPIKDFITGRITGNYDLLTDDANKVLDCVVNTEKYNQLVNDVSELCHSDKDRISNICDLIFAYSDIPNSPSKCLSNFEKSIMLDSFLDLYVDSTSTSDAYKEIKICLDNMKHTFDCNVSSDGMDVINTIASKAKTIEELKFKNNIEDVDIDEIVDMLGKRNIDNDIENELCIFEKEYEEFMRKPATEANNVDYSKYDWDDEPSKSDSQKNKDTKSEKSKSSNAQRRSNRDDDSEKDIPNHGKAKLKGMEKGIKRSAKLNKVTSKVYNEYSRYKQQEQKIDSQVSKIVANAAKAVTGTDDNTVRRRIVGRDRFSVVGVLKRLIGTYAVFCWSKIGALCLIIVRIATGKFTTDRERRRIINELEQEIEIVEEKINDARGSDDKDEKYALMRTKNNLENAVKKIKFGKGQWNQITLGGMKEAKATISRVRGEE